MKRELLNQHYTTPIVAETKRISRAACGPHSLSIQLVIWLMSLSYLFIGQVGAQGTWTPVTNLAPDPNGGVMLLMTDGTVLCHTSSGGPLGIGTIWDRLTPDSSGSYINGTWTQIAPMIRERYAFSSCVLKDGRVYAAGGEYGTDGTQAGSHGEVYNPLTNTWTACIGPNQIMSDGNCKLLDNGTVIQAIVDHYEPTSTVIYDTTANSYSIGPSTSSGQNESMWLKLPDNSILFVDEGQQTSERYIPSLNQWIADGNVPVALYDPYGFECGPAFLLPDGRAFFIGGTNHTAYYTPSGDNSPGTWVAGPDVPNRNGMPDAPGAMMVNGKILFACSPQPTAANEFATPTFFYQFDYLTGTYTQINAPGGGTVVNAICQQTDLLDLPDGSVLYAIDQDPTSAQYYIYTPDGTPLSFGKPVINALTPLSCTNYMITGTGFNGISEGSAFGDEDQSDSNYPLIRFTSGGKVYYGRSYNWNSTGVQRGNAPDTTYFTLPNGMPDGSYSLAVIANGNASDSISFIDSIPTLSSSLTLPSICSGTSFTYTPASNTIGVTLTWTRAAVTGISNAAITTPQTIDPNEVLIDTAGVPVTVVYTYTVANNNCSNHVNISVVVKPSPLPAFTAEPITSCSLPDTVRFTNHTAAGETYVWYFGDGDSSSSVNPLHVYFNEGNYTVKLFAAGACGTASDVKTDFVVINIPTAPVASSPVEINCGEAATLIATGDDTLQWYDQPTGGTLLGTGGVFLTPPLSTNTTYYVESNATTSSYCPPANYSFGTGSNFTNSNPHGVVFDVNQPCTLVSVAVYATGAGNRTINLLNSNQQVINTSTINIPNGASTITLNFPLAVGTGYMLSCGDNIHLTNLYRNETGTTYPYTDPGGYITITGNDLPDEDHYYYFYNWKLESPSCISSRTPVDIVINGAPEASFTFAGNENSVSFTNTSAGSTSWLWNFGDGNTSTLQNPVHTYDSIGTYKVTLSAYNSGCFDTITQVITILTTGISSLDPATALSIFPNPSNGTIAVSVTIRTVQQIQLIVANAIGEIIYETAPVTTSNHVFNLDLSNEAKGIYSVQLKTNNGSVIRKLILD